MLGELIDKYGPSTSPFFHVELFVYVSLHTECTFFVLYWSLGHFIQHCTQAIRVPAVVVCHCDDGGRDPVPRALRC